MKYIVIIACLLSLFSCKNSLSQEMKNIIAKREIFWRNRAKAINKENNKIEYPIKKDTTIKENRINRININSKECEFEIFIDDVLLYKFLEENSNIRGTIIVDCNINPLLLTSGTHEIKVRMYPKKNISLFEKDAGTILSLIFSHYKADDFRYMAKDNDNLGRHNGIEISQDNERWEDGKWDSTNNVGYEGKYVPRSPDKFAGLSVYEWHKTFDAQVPFSFEGWRNSINLKKEQEDDKKDIKAELVQAYKKVYQTIKDKDSSTFFSIIREREELFTSSLYYKSGGMILRQEDFINVFNTKEYELQPMFEDAMQLEFQGYGKLAILLHKADGEGIIRLRNKKNPDDNIYMDFRFQRKKKGDKLTII